MKKNVKSSGYGKDFPGRAAGMAAMDAKASQMENVAGSAGERAEATIIKLRESVLARKRAIDGEIGKQPKSQIGNTARMKSKDVKNQAQNMMTAHELVTFYLLIDSQSLAEALASPSNRDGRLRLHGGLPLKGCRDGALSTLKDYRAEHNVKLLQLEVSTSLFSSWILQGVAWMTWPEDFQTMQHRGIEMPQTAVINETLVQLGTPLALMD
jgi:hypothetical protein